MGVGVLTSLSAGFATAVTVLISVFEFVVLACAVAVFVTDPLFRSAWVIGYVAVHVTASPTSKNVSRFLIVVIAGHVTVALSSFFPTRRSSDLFPVLVTR